MEKETGKFTTVSISGIFHIRGSDRCNICNIIIEQMIVTDRIVKL